VYALGMNSIQIPLLFIGGGNMAHAIISGAQNAGVLDQKRIAVLDPNADRRSMFEISFDDPGQAVAWLSGGAERGCGVVLAVKPQMLRDATDPIRPLLEQAKLSPVVISILAGTRSTGVVDSLGNGVRVVRVMPNTPASIGLGMSAVAGSDSSTDADIELAETLMSAVGEVVRLDESMMDAFTAVAGSGPAYVFYLVEAMTKAAVSLGFDADSARKIVEQTVIGSASLLQASDDDADVLRSRVTSKNGTTYAATTTLDALGVMDAFTSALTAARDRGAELADEG
jgi:pyrroline-5-carboxylate reductase